MAFKKRKERKREEEIEQLMEEQNKIGERLRELGREEIEEEAPEHKPYPVQQSQQQQTPQVVKQEQVWIVKNIPVEYKPGVVNINTQEYFLARDVDEAKYWAKSLNMREEQKKVLVG